MRTSGEHLSSLATEGRFDEASQRDVLELAARLQKMHLETMSAEEIEQAAVEGGMNAEFVREAIRRVSSGSEQHVEEEEEHRPMTRGDWGVAIGVPTFVLSVFLLRYLYSHASHEGFLLLFGVALFAGLMVLAGIGVRSLVAPNLAPVRSLEPSVPLLRRRIQLPNALSVLWQVLIVLSLLTIPSSRPGDILDQSVFVLVMLPLVGAWEPRTKAAFWKGFGYMGTVGFLGGLLEIALNRSEQFGIIPIYMAGFGVVGALASLAGHGLRLLFYRERPAPAAQSVSARTQMLEQLFELQAALERHQETRTFLSIDVVGSTAMKAEATLEAEYSFRQYQEWIAERVRAFGGEVQISAGDGAMAMFRDSHSAIAAAKRIQVDLAEFNASKNRLTTPFRLRCGIAEGKIGIDARTPLGQIQSPVLDRAAFLQKYAEPGSVVVCRELLEVAMPVLGSLQQRELIDGKTVYSWP